MRNHNVKVILFCSLRNTKCTDVQSSNKNATTSAHNLIGRPCTQALLLLFFYYFNFMDMKMVCEKRSVFSYMAGFFVAYILGICDLKLLIWKVKCKLKCLYNILLFLVNVVDKIVDISSFGNFIVR